MTTYKLEEEHAPRVVLVPGRCRVCHCTDAEGCPPDGCSWTDPSRTLCDHCALPCSVCGEIIVAGDGGLAAAPDAPDELGIGERHVIVVDPDGETRHALHVRCIAVALAPTPRVIL